MILQLLVLQPQVSTHALPRSISATHSHTSQSSILSLSLSPPHSLSIVRVLTVCLLLSDSYVCPLSHAQTNTLSRLISLTHTLSVSCTCSLSLTCAFAHPLTRSLIHPPTHSCSLSCFLFRARACLMMIAFITVRSSLVPLIEGLCAQIYF